MFRSKSDVDIAKDRLVDTWETTRDALGPRLAAAREAMSPYVDDAAHRMAPYVGEAKTKLQPAVERIGPAVDTARTRIRTDVTPAVIAAMETAREQSAPARAEAMERAALALSALKGEKKKSRRWPIAFLCLLGGAAVGAAVGMRRSAPTPPAPPLTPPTPCPGTTSAATSEPQPVHGATTTPRAPGDN